MLLPSGSTAFAQLSEKHQCKTATMLLCHFGTHDADFDTQVICRLQRSIGNDSESAERQRKLENSFPMKRLTQPTDVANAAWFLRSDQSSFVTGTTIEVDGGRGI